MIKSFRCEATETLFRRIPTREFPKVIHRVALRKLAMIDAAVELTDLRVPPGNRLEKLAGDRKGQYSIRINDHWRICLIWKEGQAHQVEITKHYE